MRTEVGFPSQEGETQSMARGIPATRLLSLEVTQPAIQGLQSQPGIACRTARLGWTFPS